MASQKKIDWFKDIKFGLLMHWQPACQWGIVESWSVCPEDEGWCERRGPLAANYWEYKNAYENLKATFNPVRFDPKAWAQAAKHAGMRYVVFTTKHHDGFCMFDTRTTDYKITDKGCPFSANPRSDITKEIFDAFRKQGFGIGAYFSKPDWHSPDYWCPYFPPRDRNANYDVKKYPARWDAFRQYTLDQIEELMSKYGSIDILWLDGDCVCPSNKGQDLDMARIAAMARSHQPELIIVDRNIHGPHEDYRTPEQTIPETPPEFVWESCITMATSWSYVPQDTYKSARQLVHLLIEIVSKGGNLLLNIGPSPQGELPEASLDRLREVGDWMRVNGDAVYCTRPVMPYKEDKICFTENREGGVNAIYLGDDVNSGVPETVRIRSFAPRAGTIVTMPGVAEPLDWGSDDAGFIINIPDALRRAPPCKYAWVFQFRKE